MQEATATITTHTPRLFFLGCFQISNSFNKRRNPGQKFLILQSWQQVKSNSADSQVITSADLECWTIQGSLSGTKGTSNTKLRASQKNPMSCSGKAGDDRNLDAGGGDPWLIFTFLTVWKEDLSHSGEFKCEKGGKKRDKNKKHRKRAKCLQMPKKLPNPGQVKKN